MSTAIVKAGPLDIELTHALLHATGIDFRGELTIDEWVSIVPFLERAREAHKWWIGDWLVYGEHREQKWGHRYTQALSVFKDHTYDELREFASVSKGVLPENRISDVPWTFHAAVRTLPPDEQERLLSAGLTRDEIRREVKAIKGQLSAGRQLESSPGSGSAPSPGTPPKPGKPKFDPKPVDNTTSKLIVSLRDLLAANPDHKDFHEACRAALDEFCHDWTRWKDTALGRQREEVA